jgi:hypothetical protein
MTKLAYIYCPTCEIECDEKDLIKKETYEIHKVCKKIVQHCTRKIIPTIVKFDTSSSETDMEINQSCYPDSDDNKHIVNWNELNPDDDGFVAYQPEPFIIRNGSNFHATLSHEGLFPEMHGNNEFKIQLIDLDQNLMVEELPLQKGEIFFKDDFNWVDNTDGYDDSKVPTKTKCIYIGHTIHQTFGRDTIHLDYLDYDNWENPHGNTPPNKEKPIKNLIKDYNICHVEVIAQAGKIVKPFRNDLYHLHPTGKIYDFGTRNIIEELEQYENAIKIDAEKQVKKEIKLAEKEAQKGTMEMFF